MKLTITVACALSCVCSLQARISAKVERLPGGYQQILVRNDSKLDLVAFVVRARPLAPLPGPVIPSLTFFDVLEGDRNVLSPGEERGVRQVANPAGRTIFGEPIVVAGVFADGCTVGDRESLGLLMSYRSNRLAAVENSLETLMDAGRANVPRDRLVAQFKKMADGARRWYVPEEQRSAAKVYESIVDQLVNLPEQKPGAVFPPVSFVHDEVAALLAAEPSLTAGLAR